MAVYDVLAALSSTPKAVIAYSELARTISTEELRSLDFDLVYGTNVEHALIVAHQSLIGSSGDKGVVVVGHNEPSAHLMPDGNVLFNYPPVPQTAEQTLAAARACAAGGVRIDFLLVAAEPQFEQFANQLAEACHGTALTISGLGDPREEAERFVASVGLA